uniref:Uncharacterized protein n=1 Tax=Mesocestoides corti TaxID=53468 RepID=A0A5K3FPR4_MESCO
MATHHNQVAHRLGLIVQPRIITSVIDNLIMFAPVFTRSAGCGGRAGASSGASSTSSSNASIEGGLVIVHFLWKPQFQLFHYDNADTPQPPTTPELSPNTLPSSFERDHLPAELGECRHQGRQRAFRVASTLNPLSTKHPLQPLHLRTFEASSSFVFNSSVNKAL